MAEKNNITEKENTEAKAHKPLGFKVIALCVLLLILLTAVSAVLATVFDVPLFNAGNKDADGSLIYSTDSEEINEMYAYSSGMVMLTDSSVSYLDSNGKKLASNTHRYSQPVMKSNGKTVLLYDKGGTDFRLERDLAVYNTYTVNSTIVTAVLGKKNNYAYVLSDDEGYQSHLYVYSYQGKKQFEWGSASDYCIAAALSDNGKNIAVSMLGVDNGEYYSKVLLFSFGKTEAVITSIFDGCTVYELKFINNKTLAALTDNGIFVINKDGEAQKIYDFLPSELMHSDSTSSGLTAVSCARLGNTKDSVVKVFDKKFNEKLELQLTSEVNVCTSSDFVALFGNESIRIYNAKGKQTADIEFSDKCTRAVFSGRTLYVETVSGIYSFDAYTDLTAADIYEETTLEAFG